MPEKRQFDPLSVASHAPYLILVQVLRGGKGELVDFVFKVVGSEVADRIQMQLMNQRMSLVPGMSPGSPHWTAYADVATAKQPVRTSFSYLGTFQSLVTSDELMMPLSADDGDAVGHVLTAVHFP